MKKNDRIKTLKDIDTQSSGGPLIKAGEQGIVLRKHRNNTVSVQMDNFGYRRFYHENVAVV